MPKSKKETIVQCSVKVASWCQYQKVCKSLHINAVPYFCEILTNELKLIERTSWNEEERDKKTHAEEYFFYSVKSECHNLQHFKERNIAKIPMKKSLSDELSRVSNKINIGRDAIIEEVLCLILDYSNCAYDCGVKLNSMEDKIFSDPNDAIPEGWDNAALFSPLRLVEASLRAPHFFPQNFAREHDRSSFDGGERPSHTEWYDAMNELGNIKRAQESKAKRAIILAKIAELEAELKN